MFHFYGKSRFFHRKKRIIPLRCHTKRIVLHLETVRSIRTQKQNLENNATIIRQTQKRTHTCTCTSTYS